MALPSNTSIALSPVRRGALIFILITIWVDVLSWSVTAPVFPTLVLQLAGGDAAEGAAVSGLFLAMFAFIQLFASPILGALSDAHGRRPVILLACAGLALDLAIMAWAPNLWWLVLTRIVHAITSATHTTAAAYIADVTPPADRAKAFGWMGATFSFAFIVGPAIGGELGQFDLRLPFVVGSMLAFVNTLYGYFVLPESLPPERRLPFRWRTANPLGALRFLHNDQRLRVLSAVFALTQLAFQIYPALWVLYTTQRYGWEPRVVGVTLAVWGFGTVLVQALLVGPVVKRWGEVIALRVGLAFWAFSFAMGGWAPTSFFFLLSFPFGALSAFVAPALNSLMSARVSAEQQGQLQGANGAITSLTGLVGPLLYTGVFAWAVASGRETLIGVSFYIASTMVVIAWLASIHVLRKNSNRE
jgi:DHA1 family tetracycline resistance protein-like MFS transporter